MWQILSELYLDKGDKAFASGDDLQAIQLYNRALHFDPEFVKAYIHLGRVYTHEECYDKAGDCLQHALSLRPKNTETLLEVGNAFLSNGEYDHAIETFEKVVRLSVSNNPSFTKSCRCLEKAFREKGDREQSSRFHIITDTLTTIQRNYLRPSSEVGRSTVLHSAGG